MSAELQFWNCGHPRTADNTTGQAKGQCRECHRANYWSRTPEERHDDYRIRMLPSQLERARRRVRQLEAEAERYGFRDLLTKPACIDEAWERETEIARLRGRA